MCFFTYILYACVRACVRAREHARALASGATPIVV